VFGGIQVIFFGIFFNFADGEVYPKSCHAQPVIMTPSLKQSSPVGKFRQTLWISERLKTTQKRFQQKRQQRRESSFGLAQVFCAMFRIAGLGTAVSTSARETNSCFQTKDDIFVKLLSQLRIGRLMRKSNRLLLSRVGVDPGDMVCPKVFPARADADRINQLMY
jgi:hypothetical protein